jgi:hypothetical protein
VQLQESFEEVALLDFSWLGDDSAGPSVGFNYVFNHYLDSSVPMYRTHPYPRSGERTYRARLALIEAGTNPGDHPPMAGPWSNGVHGVLCRQSVGEKVWLEASFQMVALGRVDDCDLECESTAEVTGYFHASPGGPDGAHPVGHLLLGYCSGEKDNSAFALENIVCASDQNYAMSNGGHPLDAYGLCFSDLLTPGFECETPFDGYRTDNNKIYSAVGEGEAVELMATLTDWDAHSGNDNVCWSRVWTPARTLEEWAAVTGEVYLLSQSLDDNDNADCRVDIVLRSVASPPEGWPP